MDMTTTTPNSNENHTLIMDIHKRQQHQTIVIQERQSKSSLPSFRFMVLLLSLLLLALIGWQRPAAVGGTVIVHALAPLSLSRLSTKKIFSTIPISVVPCWKLHATPSDDDDDDDEEDALLDDSSLGDWRKFRASLIDEGLPTTITTTSQSSNDSDTSAPSEETKLVHKAKRKSVAAQNEALLEQQNQALAQEYKTGVWAHVIEQPEVGGLLCRMPLEAELYHGSSASISTSSSSTSSTLSSNTENAGSYWKDKLRLMVSLENDKGNITATSALTTTKLDDDENNDSDDGGNNEEATEAKVKHWFAAAERMVNQELKSIADHAKIQNGILNPNDLKPNERILLEKYLGYKQTWQEISLVLSHNPQTGISESVIINRPISTNLNKAFATVLVEGPNGRAKDSHSYEFVDDMVRAFGRQAAIYMGGPDLQEEPALLLHGLSNLRGAREVAPGTGIYQGGLEAAVAGINQGLYQPLDFRFFIGRQVYNPSQNPKTGRGNLLQKVRQGQYRPVACARSLALKQCLGLPKPLWHEVLELCGGEMKALSSIELRKRIDLQQ